MDLMGINLNQIHKIWDDDFNPRRDDKNRVCSTAAAAAALKIIASLGVHARDSTPAAVAAAAATQPEPKDRDSDGKKRNLLLQKHLPSSCLVFTFSRDKRRRRRWGGGWEWRRRRKKLYIVLSIFTSFQVSCKWKDFLQRNSPSSSHHSL